MRHETSYISSGKKHSVRVHESNGVPSGECENEEPEEEHGEDPEGEPEENLEEELTEAYTGEHSKSVSLSPSHYSNYEDEQVIEDPDEVSSGGYVSELSPKSDNDEADLHSQGGHRDSNEKKRSLDEAVFESARLQVYQSQKKCRQEEAFKPASVGSTVTDVRGKSVVSEPSLEDGSASKQEHSRFLGIGKHSRREQQHGENGKSEGDGTSKSRTTRWANDDAQLKMLGPVHLPDFMKQFVGSDLDPEIQKLKSRLSEICGQLHSSEPCDGSTVGQRCPLPLVFTSIGESASIHKLRPCKKLLLESQHIISMLIKKNPTFKSSPVQKFSKLFKKIYVPVKEYPTYNFVGLIIGPGGNSLKRMEKESGARIFLRGKGSNRRLQKAKQQTRQKCNTYDDEDLHVYIEAGNQNCLDAAVAMVEKLLIPVDRGMNDLRRAQLEELAKLKGTFRGNTCSKCGYEGHKDHACPQRQSTFQMANSCARCGSLIQSTCTCPLAASPQISNFLPCSSALCSGSTPVISSKPSKVINSKELYVGYIPQTMDETRLTELFSPFGKLARTKVIRDQMTGSAKGYGFVEFENSANAALAMTHMNGFRMEGKMLVVMVAGRPSDATLAPYVFSPLQRNSVPPSVPATFLSPRPLSGRRPWLMLQAAQASSQKSESLGFPSSSVYPGHCNAPPVTSSIPYSTSMGNFQSSHEQPSLLHPLYSGSLKQFSGDPDYPGSQFRAYFATS